MRNQSVSKKPATDGQKNDVLITVIQATTKMLPSITFDEAETISSDKSVFINAVTRALEPFIRTKSADFWFDDQARFYKEVFGLDCDYSSVKAPVSRDGFNWMIVADERITTEMTNNKCRERFPFWRWTDTSFDKIVTHNDRSEKDGTYAIWLRDTVEADEIHKNKSANDIQAAGIKGVTLREQLLLVLWHHWKYGKYLDIVNITLCTGSRCCSDGSVPDCYWAPDHHRVSVDWCFPGLLLSRIRCREVVS